MPKHDDDWENRAACIGENPDLFYPDTAAYKEAKAICARCDVRSECLEKGMGEDRGIWGGTTERERRKLRRQQALRAQP